MSNLKYSFYIPRIIKIFYLFIFHFKSYKFALLFAFTIIIINIIAGCFMSRNIY